MPDWKETAKEKQQYYCDRLDDRPYDEFRPSEHEYLKHKIAFALFGGPASVAEDADEVRLSDWPQNQQEITNSIYHQLVKHSDSDVKVAFIFLMIKQGNEEYQLPVIRFVDSERKAVFLDHLTRIYKTWENFTEWNELPECEYCFPEGGWYKRDVHENVKIAFKESPRCNVGEQIVKAADTTSTVANIGSIALMGAGAISSFLFPPAAPGLFATATYVGAASGVYSVGRNTTKLIDRGTHEQSVNPFTDAQARSCWLGAVGGALGVGTLGATKYITHLAREGEVASKFMRATFNTLNVSSLTVNGIGIVSNVYDLSQKEKVTALDVANLSLSVLFFTNSAMNLKTARTIIKETQKNVLDFSKTKLDDQAKAGLRAFEKQNKKETRSTMYGNAKTIKGLKKINSPQDFFSGLQQVRMDVNTKNVSVRINKDLLVSLDNQLKFHPTKWTNIVNQESRTKLIDCVNKISENPASAIDYVKDIKNICSKERIAFEVTRKEALKNLASKFGVDDVSMVKIGGKKVFDNLAPYEIDRIANVLESKGKHGTQEFFKCVSHVAKEMKVKSSGEYMAAAEYCFEYINELRHSSSGRKPSIGEVTNSLNESIGKTGGQMQNLVGKFKTDMSNISSLNETASPGFPSDIHATYHYHKHRMFGPRGEISQQEYFDIISDITGQKDLNINPQGTITQEGDKVTFTFQNPQDGAKCVVIQPIVNVDNQGAFVATLFFDRRIMG